MQVLHEQLMFDGQFANLSTIDALVILRTKVYLMWAIIGMLVCPMLRIDGANQSGSTHSAATRLCYSVSMLYRLPMCVHNDFYLAATIYIRVTNFFSHAHCTRCLGMSWAVSTVHACSSSM